MLRTISILLPVLVVLFGPEFARAQGDGFVTCEGIDGEDSVYCDFCHLISTSSNVLDFIITVAVIITTLMIIYAGMKLVTSAGNVEAKETAKGYLTNAVIGLVIVLTSWLLVDTIMKIIIDQTVEGGDGQGFGVWHEIDCPSQPRVQPVDTTLPAPVDLIDCDEVAGGYDCSLAVAQCISDQGSVFYTQDPSAIECHGSPHMDDDFEDDGECDDPIILTLRGGGTAEVCPCAAGAADRVNVPFMGGTAHVNKHLVPSLRRIESAWESRGGHSAYQVRSVGGYSCRNIAGTDRLSNHSYGLALDINPNENPHCPPWPQCGGRHTLITDMPDWFVNIWTSEGWGWGGNWSSSKDAMHYSKVSGEGGDQRGE